MRNLDLVSWHACLANPNAESAVKNLGPEVSKLDQRIIRIKEPFINSEDLFAKLSIALECQDWNEYC